MSSPDDDVFIKLAEDDVKLLKELENVNEDYEKTIEILQRRRLLYRKYYTQPLDPIETEIILTQDKLIQILIELAITRHELQTDIAKLTSRLDDLESRR
ncbi:MAG TPA: hypothetical protein VK566_07565 [Nitrososphaeraceae archaeon]|jgi:hypothetical protein|nr:hypothetical protein [Nitrososphaeraceae archaeon]